jgi:hypothetical protein
MIQPYDRDQSEREQARGGAGRGVVIRQQAGDQTGAGRRRAPRTVMSGSSQLLGVTITGERVDAWEVCGNAPTFLKRKTPESGRKINDAGSQRRLL